ncbi:helix-turn-helix domain-containing protein [Ruminococcaceae bacterium OttesenSCG-928-I18]|nr:helix-turn-helix domain-containing protein [Ruminococcaceae bacterium OttesenSCG-928-I18]
MVSERVRQVRKTLHLSQKEFARRLGLSKDMISNIEYQRVKPRQVLLEHLCQVYHVNPSWLFEGEGEMFSHPAGDKLREVADAFAQLDETSQEYALMQIKGLLKMQKEQSEAKNKEA